ncbi:glycosyltransferase family 2 protein [Mesorhizobium sp. M6A.T.Cr.TU.016.01.1.1]|uniref:glycosyltransferase family 2 protein n=1 Tax=Mesorhizobium sp. M6A.T.Cr.TU.016.01.1.1 TaxID=2493677 RepID=UPI000F7548F9|nr:glycosyltransferase family 2 protein [Mesorhizobium sp. M6A.T.Cr.TU.016.01.1.1]AZO63587.1 glycosyltransferase family 2 protein [Mesorhizobium sp. M6A.T.Cr.TU.016.01.1.1]
MTEASVVICADTLDRWDDLNAAIASVRRQTCPAREIILVVDNDEALLERARRGIEGVVVTPNTNVRGLCGGRTTGAGLASAPVMAFLDDDAIADERRLDELLMPYADPRVLGVGGRLEPLWRKPRPSWFLYAENRLPGKPNPARGSLAFQKPRPSHRLSKSLGQTLAAQVGRIPRCVF